MNRFTEDVYSVLTQGPLTDGDLALILGGPTWRVRNARRCLRRRGLVTKVGRRVTIRSRSRKYRAIVWGSK